MHYQYSNFCSVSSVNTLMELYKNFGTEKSARLAMKQRGPSTLPSPAPLTEFQNTWSYTKIWELKNQQDWQWSKEDHPHSPPQHHKQNFRIHGVIQRFWNWKISKTAMKQRGPSTLPSPIPGCTLSFPFQDATLGTVIFALLFPLLYPYYNKYLVISYKWEFGIECPGT